MLKSTFKVALGTLALSSLILACQKGPPENACTKNGAVGTVSGETGHTIDIPADHIKRGLGGTYAVKGDHEHVIVLKDADMKTLQGAGTIKTRTSSVNAHVHEVEIKCK